MALSSLPLSYCTNVHPGRSLAEVDAGLERYTAVLRRNYGAALAAGLWLAAPVVRELLADAAALPSFREKLAGYGLSCHTLNAFPYGDFHSRRVKENVYLPDWTDRRRLDYTRDCARVLAALLPEGAHGSISTMPLAFKEFPSSADLTDRCAALLLEAAGALERLEADTGKLIRLAIEPEPLCLIETTEEAIGFFERLRDKAAAAGRLESVNRHLGLCFDVCHQAVEFEDVAKSIRDLATANVRINKLHITCALELENPGENEAGRRALANYVEQRYLHQTLARQRTGRIVRCVDLTSELACDPPGDFRDAEAWRIHFHVPVNAESLGPLRTTRRELKQALAAVAALDYAPHLEVETYTWEVLPEQTAAATDHDLIEGLTAELVTTRALLDQLRGAAAPAG